MPLPRSPNSREKFTDRFLSSLKPSDGLYEVYELQTKGFGIRVSPKGKKTFFLLANYGGGEIRTRRRIGHYPVTSLKKAQETAKAWISLLDRGIDPQLHKAESSAANKKKYENTFCVVAEDFIARHLSTKRSEKAQTSDLRRRFISVWGDKPITDITGADVVTEIDKIVDAKKIAQALNSLTTIRKLFSWAVGRQIYGLDRSPVEHFDTETNVGKLTERKRVFSDLEWRAFLSAINRLDYPYRPLYRLLALTGQRLREIARLHWREVNLEQRLITIPAVRMKAKREHEIPVTDEILAILKSLPRFKGGDYLFSVKFGANAITSFVNTKRIIDRYMAEEMAKICAADGMPVPTIKSFIIHDIRRSVRTGFPRIKIAPHIAERVLAHSIGSKVERAYNHYDYRDEKLAALIAWGRHLAEVQNPSPPNVVKLRA